MVIGLPRDEFVFGLIMSSVHGVQHVFLRLIPPLIPILAVELTVPLWQIGMLVSVYFFAGGLIQAPMGVLSDRIDRQYLMIPSLGLMGTGYLVFAAGSTVGHVLPDQVIFGNLFTGTYQLMVCGTFISGIGHSAIHPVGYPLISANVSAENKGTVLGMWGSASKVGDALAPLVVGLLIIVFAWEPIVTGLGLLGIVYAFVLWIVFRTGSYETRPAPKTERTHIGRFRDEWKQQPQLFLFPMTVILFFFFFSTYVVHGLVTYTPVFVDDVYGYSFSIAGITFASESVSNFYFFVFLMSGAVSQIFLGIVADVTDYRATLIGSLAVAGAGLYIISTLSLGPLILLVVFVIIGSAIFGLNPARDALISEITPAEFEGRTFGYIWTIVLVVGSTYPIIIGYLADIVGIQASFTTLVVASVLGIFSVFLLYSDRIYQKRSPVGTKTSDF